MPLRVKLAICDIIRITTDICVINVMTSPAWMVVGLLSFYKSFMNSSMFVLLIAQLLQEMGRRLGPFKNFMLITAVKRRLGGFCHSN